MSSLTDSQIAQICGFDADRIAALKADLLFNGNVDGVSASGACSLTRRVTELTVSATKAYTLAAPTYAGQRKVIRCVSAASAPLGTLTISSPDDTTGFVCPATVLFDTAGQEIELEATSALKWRCIGIKRAGGAANNVVVGTTLATAMALWKLFGLSVTATVSSTTTKALPNGLVAGDRIVLNVTTAASTPSGSIDFVGRTIAGGAVTHFGGLDNTADTAVLEWDGQTWQVLYSTGVTFS